MSSVASRKRGLKDYVNLSGQRFGRWEILERKGYDDSGHLMYHTLCDCGYSGVVTATSLRTGRSRSCGCLAADMARERYSKHNKVIKEAK
jgi:hypothetical protein